MNTRPLLFFLFTLIILSCQNEKNYTTLVNPFIGTGADGNTFPGAAMPFGGVQLSPDTRIESCSGYAWPDSVILGFSHTHLSGVGEPEYRDVLFMPTKGKIQLTPGSGPDTRTGYRSAFSHSQETASPGYYSVLLKDDRIKAELTSTLRCGFHQYTFPETDSAHIIIDLVHPGGVEGLYLKKISDTELEGLRRSHGWAWDQYVYFVARFSKPFSSLDIAVNDSLVPGLTEASGTNIKASVNFTTGNNETLLVKVGISAVSTEGARKNLDAEIPSWDFQEIKKDAKNAWNKELAKIEVEGGTRDQQTVFYSAMYHACLAPNVFMDMDSLYRGVDHKVHQSAGNTHYTVFSLWDTFRALHPLFTIINQQRTNDFIRSLLQMYDDGGRLPMWPLAGNYTDDMLGYHAVPVIADAYLKGIRNYDTGKALDAMLHSAELNKLGLKYYKKIGYLPCDRQGESVSKTLEYCYDDWCIARMAKEMGKKEEYVRFNQRAHFYENVFDTTTRFMRGRRMDRGWLEPFDPTVNSAYSEGNAYQYLFVPHDVNRLIRLMGGDKEFSEWLDVLFTLKSGKNHPGDIGQYWHGNEPSHHLAYLYNYAGEPWKTQELVHKIKDQLYTNQPAGLAGNEDCGQMSAWYILSALGFYPVSPGQQNYAIGTPSFKRATIHLENGKIFIIEANNISPGNCFIRSARLNGKPWPNSFLRHEDIMKGGQIVFEMDSSPGSRWGAKPENRPFSENGEHVVSMPFILSGDTLFEKSSSINLACETKGSEIRYTLDGSKPDESSQLYTQPFTITNSCILKMKSYCKGMAASIPVEYRLNKVLLNNPVNVGQPKPGLGYRYYERFFVTTVDFDRVPPLFSGITEKFDMKPAKKGTYFGFWFDGFIQVPADGIYTFYLKSNDGSRLFIDGTELIENDANHGAVEEPGSIGLKKGMHRIEVRYFQCGGGKTLEVGWQGPGIARREISPQDLFASGSVN